MRNSSRSWMLAGCAVAAVAVVCPGQARASGITYSYSNGANSATATFQVVTGGIEVTVTNTEGNTPSAANAISQVRFTVGGDLGVPTSFTELSGTEVSYSSGKGGKINTSFTNVDFKPVTTDPNLHWGFNTAGGTGHVNLIDVSTSGGGTALTGPGGQPKEMIIAASSTLPDSSLTNTHIPSFYGSANFFLADSLVPKTLTLSDITSVTFAFGTGPETPNATGTPVPGSQPPSGTPEPSTLVGAGAAILLVGLRALRRRRAA